MAEATRRSSGDDLRRMTPEQRLAAFLNHSQFIAELQHTGGPRRSAVEDRQRGKRTEGPGESALLMADLAEVLEGQGIWYAVSGSMAGAVHGVLCATPRDASLVALLHARDAGTLQKAINEAGYDAVMKGGEAVDSGRIEVTDHHENLARLHLGLGGLDPTLLDRTTQVTLAGTVLEIVGREDFIALQVHAGGALELADAVTLLDSEADAVDLELLRRLAEGLGRETTQVIDALIGPTG